MFQQFVTILFSKVYLIYIKLWKSTILNQIDFERRKHILKAMFYDAT